MFINTESIEQVSFVVTNYDCKTQLQFLTNGSNIWKGDEMRERGEM